MAKATKPKEGLSYRSQHSDVTISFAGFLQMSGKLYTAEETAASKIMDFKSLCPTCLAGMKLSLECSGDATHPRLGSWQQCRKGCEFDGDVVVLDQDALEAAKDPANVGLDAGVIKLQIFRKEEVEKYTFPDPSGVAYVFYPTGDKTLYGLLRQVLVERPDIVLIGRTSLKTEKIMQLTVALNGQLVVRSLIAPCDVREFPYIEVPVVDMLLDQCRQAVDNFTEPFSLDSFRPLVRDSVEKLVLETRTPGYVPPTVTPSAPASTSPNLAALLAAAASKKE